MNTTTAVGYKAKISKLEIVYTSSPPHRSDNNGGNNVIPMIVIRTVSQKIRDLFKTCLAWDCCAARILFVRAVPTTSGRRGYPRQI